MASFEHSVEKHKINTFYLLFNLNDHILQTKNILFKKIFTLQTEEHT
jgi:hypothetical protein